LEDGIATPLTARKTTIKGIYRDMNILWRPKQDDQTLSKGLRLPWLAHLPDPSSGFSPSAVDRLSAEIQAFEQYGSPSEEEQRAAENALSEIIQAIRYMDDNLDVDIIGSRATGTADPLSDLDLNVSSPLTPASMNRLKTPQEILDLLEKTFRGRHPTIHLESQPVEVVINIRHAKVPILVCRHMASGLPVQIQSTPRTYDSTAYVKAFLQEYPTLKSLFKVVKQLLAMRGLTLGSHGGITSYPLLNMILASLKFCESRFARMDAGNHLLFFLDMFADIDFASAGISTRPLQYFPKNLARNQKKQSKADGVSAADAAGMFLQELEGQRRMASRRSQGRYLMTLQDPANPFNDLGRSAYMIKDIQTLFIFVRAELKKVMAEWDQFSSPQPSAQDEAQPLSLLEPCVGGDYRVYEHERGDLKLLGRKAEKPRKNPQ
jgi:DNA polymerase sigma